MAGAGAAEGAELLSWRANSLSLQINSQTADTGNKRKEHFGTNFVQSCGPDPYGECGVGGGAGGDATLSRRCTDPVPVLAISSRTAASSLAVRSCRLRAGKQLKVSLFISQFWQIMGGRLKQVSKEKPPVFGVLIGYDLGN
jgi:hypothetical protein